MKLDKGAYKLTLFSMDMCPTSSFIQCDAETDNNILHANHCDKGIC